MNTSTYSPLTDIVFQALENMYHEVYVLDRALDIIYVNGASLRNYGLYPHEMVGQNRSAFGGRYFFPGNIPNLVEAISNRVLEQATSTGRRILSMSTPVEDENGELSMLVTLTEEPLSSIDLLLAKDEKTGRYEISTAGNVFPENTGQEIVAESPSMRHVLSVARQAAKKDFPILIQGESGTGKSMLAEYIHKIGGRSGGPFYSINCAAIPEQLLQSELFGYAPYAFTGASSKGKDGLIKCAEGGTLFLDEIGELTLPLQAKLLTFLEGGTYRPIGSTVSERADVQIICATNQPLARMIQKKTFREDLYWRINVVGLEIPPLAQRPEDLKLLIYRFIQSVGQKYHLEKRLDPKAEKMLMEYNWPGNIRELHNVIERLVIVSQGTTIYPSDLPDGMRCFSSCPSGSKKQTFEELVDEATIQIVRKAKARFPALKDFMRALDVSESTARRLLKMAGQAENNSR